jgi:2-amino-4-hydroxy-6-hydroxymethyldihydropteridine diphosphokinase
VLKPLAEIAPEFIDPVRELPLAEMWRAHPDYMRPYEVRMIAGYP